MAFGLASVLVFLWKVTLSEKKHAQIVEQLKDKLATGEVAQPAGASANGAANADATAAAPAANAAVLKQSISAPVDGQVIPMKDVVDADGKVFPGKGFAIKPTSDHIYAPFDGTINFTFGTKHAFGIVSDNGLELLVHIGVGTVNMRGEGFVTHYTDGQKVKKGDLLFDFDRQAIKDAGYQDTVVNFFTQPGRINNLSEIDYDADVKHGDAVTTVSFK